MTTPWDALKDVRLDRRPTPAQAPGYERYMVSFLTGRCVMFGCKNKAQRRHLCRKHADQIKRQK